MRILMLSKACLVGAYQTKLEEIGRLADVELTVIVPPSWNDPSGPIALERSHTSGYQLLVNPIRFNGQYHLYYFAGLKRRLLQLRPDIVHIDEEPYNLATWLAQRQARAVGARTLFFSWQNLERNYPFPFNHVERQVLRRSDYAIMGNQDAAEVWRRKGYHGPFRVFPQFGVDPELYHPPERREEGGGFVIGAANRRLVHEKGVDILMRAAAKLPGIWRLHITGDGPAKPSLKELADDLGISDRVCFDGIISSAEMPAYLHQLNVLVLASRTLPTWKEQFGRILVEAMACGVPVVGSNSGEIPNVIGSAGLIFPEDDADALTEHLQHLMQSESLGAQLRRSGRQRVLEKYTQSQIAGQTVAVYRDMLAA